MHKSTHKKNASNRGVEYSWITESSIVLQNRIVVHEHHIPDREVLDLDLVGDKEDQRELLSIFRLRDPWEVLLVLAADR